MDDDTVVDVVADEVSIAVAWVLWVFDSTEPVMTEVVEDDVEADKGVGVEREVLVGVDAHGPGPAFQI